MDENNFRGERERERELCIYFLSCEELLNPCTPFIQAAFNEDLFGLFSINANLLAGLLILYGVQNKLSVNK